jgi:hypothetical protein
MQDGVMPTHALDQVLRLPLYCGRTAAVSELNEGIQSYVLDCSVLVQDDGTNYTELFHCLHYHNTFCIGCHKISPVIVAFSFPSISSKLIRIALLFK